MQKKKEYPPIRSIRIPAKTWAGVKALAKKERRSVGLMVNMLLEKGIEGK